MTKTTIARFGPSSKRLQTNISVTAHGPQSLPQESEIVDVVTKFEDISSIQTSSKRAFFEATDDKFPTVLFVQCAHGGIEPRWNPRPLLDAPATVCYATMPRNCSAGFTWSDFTGVPHALHASTWVGNTRGGDSGFIADIEDTARYMRMQGLAGFFRGHQDEECSFKLLKLHHPFVVPWEVLLATEGFASSDQLCSEGFELGRFCHREDTAPVFTFSSAAEARALPDEGFAVCEVGRGFPSWRVKVYTFPVVRAGGDSGGFVQSKPDGSFGSMTSDGKS
jgi:hypothetical protein